MEEEKVMQAEYYLSVLQEIAELEDRIDLTDEDVERAVRYRNALVEADELADELVG